jgi:hypothetical protein
LTITLYSYWVKLYCTSSFATDLGQKLGYPKFKSTFEQNGDTVRITCDTNGPKEVIIATISTELDSKAFAQFPVPADAEMNKEAFVSFMKDKPCVSKGLIQGIPT